MADWDLVLVGGGLQNGLIALGALARRPDAKVLLIERGATLGGNHTWSFHCDSVPAEARAWFEPLVEHRWERYRVRFPGLDRIVPQAYATCSSEHFARVLGERLAAAPNAALWLETEVDELGSDSVRLADGTVVSGRCVVDARGPRGPTADSGYQKFVGLEVELATPVDASTAMLMDATVAQTDAFRFVYLLPLSPTRALIEDTCFANGADLDVPAVRERVLAWIAERGLRVRAIVRQEHGVLPMPWRAAGPIARVPPLVAGYRGGWFHPATGYSMPVALRLACHVARTFDGDVFGPAFDALATEQERQAAFGHLLNELLFVAAEPDKRWMIFRHFYELPDDLTLRFYSASLSGADRRRMFLRKPPPGVSFWRAMKIFSARGLSLT